MIYPHLDLRTVGFIVGAFLVLSHAIGILVPGASASFLRQLPRSKTWGFILLTIAALWAFLLVANMDLGDFTSYRHNLMFVVAAAYFLTLKFVDEFLAVRAAGMLLLLLAEPLLEAAFLRPETSRLALVVLAYGWVVVGTFWVGMPYLMRDQIAWLLKSPARWRLGCWAGVLYGGLLLICSAILHRSA